MTHTPKDVPEDVLAQLGHRVQHALRAFSPDDEKALRATANTFPRSDFYDIPKVLTSLGIGEALVTVLSPRGTPTPVVATLLRPPSSRMGPVAPDELKKIVDASPLRSEYAQAVDRESAREVLEARAGSAPAAAAPASKGKETPKEASLADTVGKALSSPAGKTLQRELVRGLLGVLGVRAATRRRRSGW